MSEQSVTLYYRQGTSDKVYYCEIVKADDYSDFYIVNFAYGRRGSNLKTGTKTPTPTRKYEAEHIYNKIVREKLGKGYRQTTQQNTVMSNIIKQERTAKPQEKIKPRMIDDDFIRALEL